MAHDPFAPATRRPKPTDAAQTPQDAFSGPPAGLTPDPPGVAPGALDSEQGWGAQAWDVAQALPPLPETAYPPDAVPLPEPEPQKPGHPCRVCGQVLASPGALGGHMAAHRKRGELD